MLAINSQHDGRPMWCSFDRRVVSTQSPALSKLLAFTPTIRALSSENDKQKSLGLFQQLNVYS